MLLQNENLASTDLVGARDVIGESTTKGGGKEAGVCVCAVFLCKKRVCVLCATAGRAAGAMASQVCRHPDFF